VALCQAVVRPVGQAAAEAAAAVAAWPAAAAVAVAAAAATQSLPAQSLTGRPRRSPPKRVCVAEVVVAAVAGPTLAADASSCLAAAFTATQGVYRAACSSGRGSAAALLHHLDTANANYLFHRAAV